MLCPPPRNLAITEEDPEFVTLTWSPPVDTGYAPFLLRYELKYSIVTNTTQNLAGGATSGELSTDSGYGYNYYVNHLTPNWLKISNMDLVFDIPKATFTEDPYYVSDSVIVYTLRAITHVGDGYETSVAGVLYAS
jgi:hypothetical protein